jgi:hypothetical protein
MSGNVDYPVIAQRAQCNRCGLQKFEAAGVNGTELFVDGGIAQIPNPT